MEQISSAAAAATAPTIGGRTVAGATMPPIGDRVVDVEAAHECPVTDTPQTLRGLVRLRGVDWFHRAAGIRRAGRGSISFGTDDDRRSPLMPSWCLHTRRALDSDHVGGLRSRRRSGR